MKLGAVRLIVTEKLTLQLWCALYPTMIIRQHRECWENCRYGLLVAFSHFRRQSFNIEIVLQGEGNRSTLIRHIITSIIASETLYVECLNKMMQVSVNRSRVTFFKFGIKKKFDDKNPIIFTVYESYQSDINYVPACDIWRGIPDNVFQNRRTLHGTHSILECFATKGVPSGWHIGGRNVPRIGWSHQSVRRIFAQLWQSHWYGEKVRFQQSTVQGDRVEHHFEFTKWAIVDVRRFVTQTGGQGSEECVSFAGEINENFMWCLLPQHIVMTNHIVSFP